ncbi:hypothetical protein [Caulobacter sp. BE254]|uniref:hypothetical protein n=1 Tax=Caulobacter sp. BE254 TaxID=2817720 RepID=UPI00285AFE08|nr:hypothetical protein [Caulobacter sp. BE254]MDR7116422.1 hypothetical protein [Caulobacter sp. BE254]
MAILFPLALALATASAGDGCDATMRQAAVDRLEDQAFVAMKSATEKVTQAAKSGSIGPAGDAEWAVYKQLRAEAERMRLTNARELAACQADLRIAATSPAPAPVPPTTYAAADATTAPPPIAKPRRLRMSVSAGVADIDDSRRERFDTRNLKGVYGDVVDAVYNDPTSTDLNVAATLAAPIPTELQEGSFTWLSNSVTAGPTMRLEKWSNRYAISMAYAVEGWNAPGWRFSGEVSSEIFHMKGSMTYANGGFARDGDSVLGACLAGHRDGGRIVCDDYGRKTAVIANPIVLEQTVKGDVVFNADTLLSTVSSNFLSQRTARTEGVFGVARALPLETPIGALRIVPGLEVAGGWWSYAEDETMEGRRLNRPASPPLFLSRHNEGSGPTARLSGLLSVEGEVPVATGLHWGLAARYGVQWINLDMFDASGPTKALSQSKSMAGLGGWMEYDFTQGWSARLSVDRQDYVWLSSDYGLQAFGGLRMSQGRNIRLSTSAATIFGARLQYDF